MLKNYIFFFLFICGSAYAQHTGTFDGNSKQKLIENEKLANAISLYPNPVGEVLRIRSQGIPLVRIEIVSILGGKVKQINSNFKFIYLDDLSRGLYLIKIYSGKGYTVKKLIKK